MRVSSYWLARVAAAAILLAASTPALSADILAEPEPLVDDNYWYVSIHGGIKFGEEWDDGDLEFESDNGWRVGGTVGYSLTSIFSVEGELSYMRQELEANDGDISIGTGMINLVAGMPLGTSMRPYVGAGAGLAHVSVDVNLPAPLDLDDSELVFAAQGLAGLDFVVSERFAIGARYRLLHLADVELESDSQSEHDLDPDLIHSIEAVFTVGF